jgi:hypothetical protein
MNTSACMRRLATMAIMVIAASCAGAADDGRSSTPTLVSGARQHDLRVLGSGSYPGYTVVMPDGWVDLGGHFVVKYPSTTLGPVLGLSVWDVGRVFRDPCKWQGQDYDPGPGVDALVAALVAQPLRNATGPTDVTLAGYRGKYLEWSVPADSVSSIPTDFDRCDLDPADGHHNFESWLARGNVGNRYQQVPGQVDRVWVLDVAGLRLVVDATYSPDTSADDRDELERIVNSLRFVAR